MKACTFNQCSNLGLKNSLGIHIQDLVWRNSQDHSHRHRSWMYLLLFAGWRQHQLYRRAKESSESVPVLIFLCLSRQIRSLSKVTCIWPSVTLYLLIMWRHQHFFSPPQACLDCDCIGQGLSHMYSTWHSRALELAASRLFRNSSMLGSLAKPVLDQADQHLDSCKTQSQL